MDQNQARSNKRHTQENYIACVHVLCLFPVFPRRMAEFFLWFSLYFSGDIYFSDGISLYIILAVTCVMPTAI
jgi:hypothetical protein